MRKAYKITKHTVMFDKKNPKTVYSVQPVSDGLLTTDDVARQIAAESSATPGDVKNVLDRYAHYVKENWVIGTAHFGESLYENLLVFAFVIL